MAVVKIVCGPGERCFGRGVYLETFERTASQYPQKMITLPLKRKSFIGDLGCKGKNVVVGCCGVVVGGFNKIYI